MIIFLFSVYFYGALCTSIACYLAERLQYKTAPIVKVIGSIVFGAIWPICAGVRLAQLFYKF